MSDSDPSQCASAQNAVDLLSLRVASLFIIGAGSMLGALFPVVARRSKFLKVPPLVFDFAKYFGSGVIIATSFIHLLAPALEALGSKCLTGVWTTYPWALAISMASVFAIFFLELIAFRWGSAKLVRIGLHAHDPHGHDIGHQGAHGAHGPEVALTEDSSLKTGRAGAPSTTNGSNASLPALSYPSRSDMERDASNAEHDSDKRAMPTDAQLQPQRQPMGGILDGGVAQIVGITILEFGVVFHSVLIGLTLAVNQAFKVLFVVLVFHQTFEGLGLGARLAFMPLSPGYTWVPIAGAVIYGLSTPLGIAIGLGVRATYNPESTTAVIISGMLDAVSSGILLYTGLVELLAHEFLFNPAMHTVSNGKLVFASGSMLFGAGLMALLGRWA